MTHATEIIIRQSDDEVSIVSLSYYQVEHVLQAKLNDIWHRNLISIDIIRNGVGRMRSKMQSS